jgi:hypothetical protein
MGINVKKIVVFADGKKVELPNNIEIFKIETYLEELTSDIITFSEKEFKINLNKGEELEYGKWYLKRPDIFVYKFRKGEIIAENFKSENGDIFCGKGEELKNKSFLVEGSIFGKREDYSFMCKIKNLLYLIKPKNYEAGNFS